MRIATLLSQNQIHCQTTRKDNKFAPIDFPFRQKEQIHRKRIDLL